MRRTHMAEPERSTPDEAIARGSDRRAVVVSLGSLMAALASTSRCPTRLGDPSPAAK